MTQAIQKTKAEMLSMLKGKVSGAHVLESFYFEAIKWKKGKAAVLEELEALKWYGKELIVRSSSTMFGT